LQSPISLEDLDKAPSALPRSSDVDWEAKYHQISEKFTKVSDEKFNLQEENGRIKAHNGTRELLDQLIKPYASSAFKFMCAYCLFVAVILVCQGFNIGGFTLQDGVLQLLVGSTAVTVIGLVGMVLTGVFVGARRH
jgi:hypothetical protein